MSDLIDTVFEDRLRLDKWTREELRSLVAKKPNLRRFSRRLSDLLKSTKGSDPHLLEDFFILGVAIRDVVRGPLPLDLEKVTMPIVAFVYGYTHEPFGAVFKKGAIQEIRLHVFGNVPKPSEVQDQAKSGGATGKTQNVRAATTGSSAVTLPYEIAAE